MNRFCNDPRCRNVLLATGLALLLALPARSASAQQRPPAAKLLPQNTVFLLSVADAQDLAKRFKNTAMGRMSEDPKLKPLVNDLYGSVTDLVANLKDQVGLSLPEILEIPQGEMTLAVIASDQGTPAVVALIDAGDKLSNARKLLKRGTEELEKQNVAKAEETVLGTKLVVYDGIGPQKRKAAYFEKESTLVLGTDLAVLKQLLAVWNGESAKTLSENEKYSAIMRRCRGSKDQPPQFFWYFDPIALLKNIGQNNTQVRVVMATMPVLGLDGLLGMGGSIILDSGQFDSIAHFHLLLDNPRRGIVEMIALEPGDVKPEPWVPVDVASYTTFHWRFQTTFNNLVKIIDSLQGEGAVSRNLKQRVLEPTGVDLEREILPVLEGRVTHISRIDREAPISLASNATLWAIKLKETKPAEEALEKLAKKYDQTVKPESYAGVKYYRIQPPQPRRRTRPTDPTKPQPPDQPKPQPKEPPILSEVPPPQPCVGVVKDCLMFSDREGLYQKVVASANNPGESLANALDFKLIMSKIVRQSGGNKPAMVSFNRPEEGIRYFYDLANAERTRERLRRGAESNAFWKSVQGAMEKNPLPPFSVLQQYLAPGGAMVLDDESGFHYTAFTLKRKQE
jgi:hypothetical protein